MASSINNPAWMEWVEKLMGGVSWQTYTATFPPDRFYCLLDELPLHLIPQRSRDFMGKHAEQRKLFLNPQCILCRADEVPEGVRRELLSGFALQGMMAWVADRSGGAWLPFWLGPEFEGLLRGLRRGEEVPSSAPDAARRILTAAGIFLSDSEANGERERDLNAQLAATQFREKMYAPLPNLIHPFHVAALRRYYRHQVRSGAIELGDGQSERRYVAYNEPVARFFHHQIASKLSAVAGELLKPSYVYFASYLSGAELHKHTDREQCEFSITLCLDFSPETALATPWPIQLDTPHGVVTVYQALGDGLAYRGTRLPHYRGVLGEGWSSTSIFFHYVAEDFAGPLE